MVRVPKRRLDEVIAERLQWSHVFSDMVRAFAGLSQEGWCFASMEPCLFRHGKGDTTADPNAAKLLASMEPCLFRHGKRSVPLIGRKGKIGFNGAMSFQTW